MRPLGGIVIGYIGDRVSRQAALTVSIVAMAIPTFLVGIMPGYDTIGIAAPILLTLCRIIQGLSVGGEYPTSLVYMIEKAPANKRGFVGAMGSSSAYIGIFVYIVSWLELVDKIAPSKSLEINTLSMIVLVPLTLLAGALSDRIGRKPVLIIGALAGFIFSIPLMYGMYHQSALVIQLSQIGFALVVGLFNGAMPALIVESAPAYIRTTVVALGYNLTMGILGGLTPLVASWLIHRTENEMIPAYMIVAVAAVSLVAVMFVSESYKKDI